MKRLLLALVLCTPLYAAPISRETRAMVIAIASEHGIPKSVAVAIIDEESEWDALAVSAKTSEGYRSRGLLQIYEKFQEEHVQKFYHHDPKFFDVWNPIDSAEVGFGLLAEKHEELGSWYLACVWYNHGDTKTISPKVHEYAMRIINAPWRGL